MLTQYVADAFTDRLFGGNPAAVCPLDRWPPDALMQQIAIENNLSETAFVLPEGEHFRLRWFTPGGEIDLCGHATLATAYVLLTQLGVRRDPLVFLTRSGRLSVRQRGTLLEMDFPAYPLTPVPVTDAMAEAFGVRPREAYLGRDLLCVFDSAETVRALSPDLDRLRGLEGLLQHATAAGDGQFDCVSRSFAPKLDVPEDPVCGSGHCHIVPYWADKLGKDTLLAYQASRRGGILHCRLEGDRVTLAGESVLFARAELMLELPH